MLCEEQVAAIDPIYKDLDPLTRTDNVPQGQLLCVDQSYLTGYVQALVDMHYYEFGVKIIVRDSIAYVYNLPKNQLISNSIICFIYDVPGICNVICMPCDICPICGPICVNNYSPCCEIKGIWFPQTTVLFSPLIADPRQVTNSAAFRFNDCVIGKHVGAVSFGDQFVFYRWRDIPWLHGDLEAGIEAGIFAVFDLDHPKACHVNTDFYVAVLTDYAFDNYSFRGRLWHQSSHLGDEFLLSNPGFDRRNLSDEGVDFFASYQLGQPIRLYAGIGYIFDRDKEFPEKPLYFEFGSEVKVFGERHHCNKLYIEPFLAMHFRTWEEHAWNLDQTYALGIEIGKIQGVGKKMRLFLEYHEGFSKEGQFLRERCSYSAIRMTYGF